MGTGSNTDIDYKILGFLQETNTPEDNLYLKKWIASSTDNRTYFNELKEIWISSNKINDFDAINVNKTWRTFQEKSGIQNKSNTQKNVSKDYKLLKIAASFLVLFGVSYFVFQYLTYETTLIAQSGKNNKFTLPDGSDVWLKNGSRLSYTRNFNQVSRSVTLHGEGYFDISSDRKKPFEVTLNNTKTTVLGTRFNLGVQSETKNVQLVLVEGSVQFTFNNNKVVLSPGERISTTTTGKIIKDVNKDLNFDAWKTKTLQFKNQPLPLVFNKLQSFYNVMIDISKTNLQMCKATTSFKNQSLNEVLDELSLLFKFKYQKEGKDRIIILEGGC